jgi:hypothetical protein
VATGIIIVEAMKEKCLLKRHIAPKREQRKRKDKE